MRASRSFSSDASSAQASGSAVAATPSQLLVMLYGWMEMTARSHAELSPLLPALLDALTHASTGIVLVGDAGADLERWYANEPAAALLGYTIDELYAVPVIETAPSW